MFKNLELEFPSGGVDFNQAVKLFEVNLIQQALRQTEGHQTNAAKLLNLKTSTLNSIVKRYKISY
jgi:transcriptional regulator with GAF, ATPase, and Fis domain